MLQTKKASLKEDRRGIALTTRGTDKVKATVTGCFFIAATVFAIIGLKLYDPLLTTSDYLQQGAAHSAQIIVGAVCEMILVVSACGTAIMLFPYLKAYNERLAFGYYTFRFLEAIVIVLGVVSMLSLLTLSHSFTTSSNPDSTLYYTLGTLARAFHAWTFLLGPKFLLGINTFIYSYVFFKTGLVPKRLALLGLTGACLVFINALLEMFGFIVSFSVVDIVLVFPIAIYEMILAAWLIRKGFKLPLHQQQS